MEKPDKPKTFADGAHIKVKNKKGKPCECGCCEYSHQGRGKYVCTGCGKVHSFAQICVSETKNKR